MGLGTGYTCVQHQEMTAGMTANLEAVAPVSAQPGDFAIVEVKSLVEDVTTCDPVLGQDYYHFRPVGVYVCASEGNDCTQNSDCCPSLICNASGQEPVCSPPNCGGPNVPCQSGAACCSGSCDTNAGFCN
jgi:hypothetical protein